ncbi:uncharacterized protein E5676_scaffold194G002310 [Cucumis melo var. makuwa]|uniref:Retrotransposon gag domain-containing protein n=1 Tax=Cucumis melo var. makuwa TaxID=1194695 RepID=A0A5D3BC45_CUCMM|nr:uncharacterized protein E5676_scaffold194G002310 [Cucumis melo var. makuwa]
MRAMANQAPAGEAIPISRYFRATNTVTEEAKVTLAMMHLPEDVKLWWRSQYVDMQEGRCTIDTWDALKGELRSQLFLENVEIFAQRKLHELKHTGNIREYVKQFAGLMLDIRDMSEKDKVFCFVEGLKPWAKTKLYEQRVQDLTSAYVAVERLFDQANDSQDVRRHPSSSFERNKNNRLSSPKTAGGDKRFNEDLVSYVRDHTWPDNARTKLLSMHSRRRWGQTNTPAERGLMYVDTWINQKPTKSTMVDSVATHNFITEAEAKHLNLHWEKDAERMEAVNSAALPIIRLVKRTMIRLGGWSDLIDFVVVKMDDFDVVLGIEFLLEHQVIPMPLAKCLVITGSNLSVVQTDLRQPDGLK